MHTVTMFMANNMIIDRLFEEVQKLGPICVGLDTDLSYIPEHLNSIESIADRVFKFNKDIIDSTEDLVAVYKLQIAYYEALGVEGLMAYKKTLEYLRVKNKLSIGDIKRSDIAKTAEMYAKAHFEGDFEADFITLSPFMGYDSIKPYLSYLESGEKGIFVLLRTSNPGALDIEYLESKGETLYNIIGDNLDKIAEKYIGDYGYSSLGFVVGDNIMDSGEQDDIRKRFPRTFFLIPGYGAQGGKASTVRKLLNELNGGVVNSSRGIITSHIKHKDEADYDDKNYTKYIREAVLKMKEDICG